MEVCRKRSSLVLVLASGWSRFRVPGGAHTNHPRRRAKPVTFRLMIYCMGDDESHAGIANPPQVVANAVELARGAGASPDPERV